MTVPPIKVVFRGVRGSIPVSGPAYQRYGGNTVCTEIRCGEHVLMFDAGTGLPRAGADLKAERVRDVNLFLSHCHYDHMLGLMYFAPLYDPACSVTLWSGHLHGTLNTETMLREFMSPPWFPVGPEAFRARLGFRDFSPGDVLQPYEDVSIRTGMLNHPGGSVGYRVEWGGKAVAIITDTEHSPGCADDTVAILCEKADLVLYDASYTDAEMPQREGFGHSSWEQGIRIAQAAGAGRIAFIHHTPTRTDDELDEIARRAAALDSGAFFAQDGQVIEV